MQTKQIKILGFSEATLTMVFDIMESNGFYPKVQIINNINYKPIKEFINDKFEISISEKNYFSDNDFYILGATQKLTKVKILENFSEVPTENFIILKSKNVDISSTVNLGYGSIINGMVCIAGHATLSDFVFVNRNVSIGHHTKIGKYTTINPGANIAGNVVIGEFCQIGIGVNIFDGIKIGNNVTIGGGSVVTKDLPDNVIAYGNPCKIIKQI